jgi:hypothetical protein
MTQEYRELNSREQKLLSRYFERHLTAREIITIFIFFIIMLALMLGVLSFGLKYGKETPPLPPGSALMYTGV